MSSACKITCKISAILKVNLHGAAGNSRVLCRVKLPIFTGKLQVTHVNCVWGLFTCGLKVRLTAFAGNFARISIILNDNTVGLKKIPINSSPLIFGIREITVYLRGINGRKRQKPSHCNIHLNYLHAFVNPCFLNTPIVLRWEKISKRK